jgi:hypothetical protein
MRPVYKISRHARARSAQRSFPTGIAYMIIDFGEPWPAGRGAVKYVLHRRCMPPLRREYGSEVAVALEPFRRRGAYVVVQGNTLITLAYAGRRFKERSRRRRRRT